MVNVARRAVVRRRRVVVIDREQAFQRKAVRYLEECGHDAAGFDEAGAAAEDIRRRTPDLVVVDIGLAGGAGLGLYRAVRADPGSAHVPFLFVGRGGHPLEVDRGIRLVSGALLRKPFTRRQLASRLGPMFDRLDRIQAFGEAGRFRGDLSILDLHDALGVIRAYRLTGRLSLEQGENGATAEAIFLRGCLVHASSKDATGGDVLMEVMLWSNLHYEFLPDGPSRLEACRTVSPVEWEETLVSLNLVDRGRLNPFPVRSAFRTMSAVGVGNKEAASSPRNADMDEPVLSGPPPPRWEEEDEDVEILVCDDIGGLPDRASVDLTPLPTTIQVPEGASSGPAQARSSVLAYLVRRRTKEGQRQSLEELLLDARGVAGGDLQLQTGGGLVLASTAEGDARRDLYSSWGELANALALGPGSRTLRGRVDGLGHAFDNGATVVWFVAGDVQLLYHAPDRVGLGASMLACRRLAVRIGRALGDVSGGVGAGLPGDGDQSVRTRNRAQAPVRARESLRRVRLSGGRRREVARLLGNLRNDIHALEAAALVDAEGRALERLAGPDVPMEDFGALVSSLARLGKTVARSSPAGPWRMLTAHGPGRFLAAVPVGPEAVLAALTASSVRPGLVLLKLTQVGVRISRVLSSPGVDSRSFGA